MFFCAVAIVWLIFDRLTKNYFDSAYELGQSAAAGYPFLRFRLVHNTGMAWGMLDDATLLLGIFSSLVCVVVVLAWIFWPRLTGRVPTNTETLGMALVFAGGLGNAADRFVLGYVVDFIEITVIDFPVFNIADIGITCGYALLIIGYLGAEIEIARHKRRMRKAAAKRKAAAAPADESRRRVVKASAPQADAVTDELAQTPEDGAVESLQPHAEEASLEQENINAAEPSQEADNPPSEDVEDQSSAEPSNAQAAENARDGEGECCEKA